MNVLWLHVPPHTPWGWAFEIGLTIGILWLIGFGIIVVIGCMLDSSNQPSYQSGALQQHHQASRAIALREQQEASRARKAIDSIYRQAEEDVRRLGQLGSLISEGRAGPKRAHESAISAEESLLLYGPQTLHYELRHAKSDVF